MAGPGRLLQAACLLLALCLAGEVTAGEETRSALLCERGEQVDVFHHGDQAQAAQVATRAGAAVAEARRRFPVLASASRPRIVCVEARRQEPARLRIGGEEYFGRDSASFDGGLGAVFLRAAADPAGLPLADSVLREAVGEALAVDALGLGRDEAHAWPAACLAASLGSGPGDALDPVTRRGHFILLVRLAEEGRAGPLRDLLRVSRADLRRMGRAEALAFRARCWGLARFLLSGASGDAGRAFPDGLATPAGRPDWPALEARLAGKDLEQAWKAFLGRLAGPDVPAAAQLRLRARLGAKEADARLAAVRALRDLGGRGSLGDLGRLALGDPEPAVRLAAVEAVRGLNHGLAPALWTDALAAPNGGLAARAADALGALGDVAAVGPLVAVLARAAGAQGGRDRCRAYIFTGSTTSYISGYTNEGGTLRPVIDRISEGSRLAIRDLAIHIVVDAHVAPALQALLPEAGARTAEQWLAWQEGRQGS